MSDESESIEGAAESSDPAQPTHRSGSGSVSAEQATSSSPRRFTLSRALVATAVVALVAIGLSTIGSEEAPPDMVEPRSVAIPTFEFAGVPRLQGLSTGVASLMSAQFERADLMPIVEPDRIGDRGVLVEGTMSATEDSLRLEARIRSAAGVDLGVASVQGVELDFAQLVDDLAFDVMRQVLTLDWPELKEDWVRLAADEARSIEALAFYLRGQGNLAAGRFFSAESNFGRAIRGDSLFSLAYYGLSLAQGGSLEGVVGECSARRRTLRRPSVSRARSCPRQPGPTRGPP